MRSFVCGYTRACVYVCARASHLLASGARASARAQVRFVQSRVYATVAATNICATDQLQNYRQVQLDNASVGTARPHRAKYVFAVAPLIRTCLAVRIT